MDDLVELSDKLYALFTNILGVLSILYVVYACVSSLLYIVLAKTFGNGNAPQWAERITGQDYMLDNNGVKKVILRLITAAFLVAFLMIGGHYFIVTEMLKILVFMFG